MQTQLNIFTPETFENIRRVYSLQEQTKLEKELEHCKNVIAGFKGYRTKRKKHKQ